MRSRLWLRTTAVLLALIIARAAGVAAQDIIIRVPVEPSGTAARVTLPFGEPFLLVGAAPETFRTVDVRYDEYHLTPPGAERCRKLFEAEDTTVLGWARSGPAKADTFAVHLLEGLRANRRYGFCLRTHSRFAGGELQSFQDSAYRILENTFAALDSAGHPPQSLDTAQIQNLQRTLADALPQAPGQTVVTTGTLFDTRPPATSETTLLLVADIMNARRSRFNAARTWTSGADVTKQGLLGMRRRVELGRIAGRLAGRDRVPGMDSASVERALATARLLATGDPRLLDAALSGEVVLASSSVVPAQPIPARLVTDPAEVTARTTRLDTTYLRLTELRELVAAVESSPGLQRRADVGGPAARDLRAAVDVVREQFSGVRAGAADWIAADAERRRLLRGVAGQLRVVAENNVSLVGTSISSFETRAKQYVTADIGVAYAPWLGQAAPYFGANFYLSALNKRVPMRLVRDEIAHWSFTVGLTATSLKQEGERDDLFSSYSLLLGGGRRITDAIRVTGGGVVFRDRDDNPLLDNSSIVMSPFFSLSFDFDARAALGRVGDILSK